MIKGPGRSERRPRVGGFTLVEILMGIMIFGIISATVYGVFSNAVRLNRQAQNIEGLYRDARWMVDTLARDLDNMVSYQSRTESSVRREVIVREATQRNVTVTQRDIRGISEEGQTDSSFIGREKSLAMVIADGSGLKEIAYYLQPAEESRIYQVMINRERRPLSPVVTSSEGSEGEWFFLIREERPFPYRDIADVEDIQKEIIGTHIQRDGLRFSYWGAETAGPRGEPEWEAEWDENVHPAALRFEITLILPPDGRRLSVDKRFFIPPVLRAESMGGVVIRNE